MLHLRKVPYIEQMQQTECGLCCIAMLLRYYKSNETLSLIRNELTVGRDGLRLSDLQTYLNNRNFDTHIYRVTSNQISSLPLPAVAYWDKKHFVIVESINTKQAIIIDPAYGRLRLSIEEFNESYSGIMMTAEPTENFQPYSKKVNPWSHVLQCLKSKKKLLIRTFVISLLAYGVQMVAPLLIQVIIDGLMSNQASVNLDMCIMLAMGIFILYGMTSFMQQLSLTNFQIEIDKSLTKDTFHKLVSLPYSYFENRSNGDLLFRLSSLDIIRTLLSDHIISGVIQAGYSLAILIYLCNKSLLLAGITTSIFLVNGIFILFMRERIMEANQIQVVENTKLESVQTETIYSIFGIKTSGIEKDIWNNWNDRYVRSLKAYKEKGTILNIYSTIISLLQLVGPLIVLLFGIQQSLMNKITIGESVACYSLAASFIGTSLSLFNLWNDFMMASTYLDRIVDITTEPSEENPENPIPLAINGNIEFRNVSFAYSKKSNPVIDNLSFSIPKGSKFAIVGPSGSGKSTITKLLLGLYKPTSGAIYYEGINIDALDKTELRKQIGIVPQDMTLFNRSIGENIALNEEDYNLDEVMETAKIAQIHDEIMSMPMNYRTIISDMGGNLSGGQRQRIILARAIKNKPHLMIMDEATSSLDNVNEAKVSKYFKECGSTQVIIAHRMSTIIDADTILVLDKGKKAEIGTHEELMKQNGIYAELYKSRSSIPA
ncbi:MAG: peptidase domain-containing ABC transporter [Lachnospiraceae bacterium]|nr:peptidase domain-containing ABC transporter [Lachnospiraceae bacterium]MBQ5560898.1 peptidase domain-containing ABC transporter [Lachnospiraceae bacterium]